MSLTCKSQTFLACTTGTSDKLYVIQVEENTILHTFEAVGYYGRRGKTLSKTVKYSGPSSSAALAAAVKLETEKRSKGYVSESGAIPGMPAGAPSPTAASTAATPVAAVSSVSRPVVGPSVMLALPVEDEAHALAMLDANEWICQKKYDGERVTVSLRRSKIEAFNRKGQSRPLSKAVEDDFKRLLGLPDFSGERETILDGELMGNDTYIAYDLLFIRDRDVQSVPYFERFGMLECLLETHPHLLVATAWDVAEKRTMYSDAHKHSWEGLMFRHVLGPYTPGRACVLLKHKLWATATCRVLTVNKSRSVQIALLDDKGLDTPVGNVTIPVNQPVPNPYDLVEVRYLYCLPGGSLYQPVCLGIRNDVDEADLLSQVRQAPPEKL